MQTFVTKILGLSLRHFPGDETNADPVIIDLLRHHDEDNDGKVDGIVIQNNPYEVNNEFCLREFKAFADFAEAFDKGTLPADDSSSLQVASACFDALVREGNSVARAQYLWSVACAGDTAVSCRQSMLRFIFSGSGEKDPRGRKFYTSVIPDRSLEDVFISREVRDSEELDQQAEEVGDSEDFGQQAEEVGDSEDLDQQAKILKNGLAGYAVSEAALAAYPQLLAADFSDASRDGDPLDIFERSLLNNVILGVKTAIVDPDSTVSFFAASVEEMATARSELASMLLHAHKKDIHQDTALDPVSLRDEVNNPVGDMLRGVFSVVATVLGGGIDFFSGKNPLFPRLIDNQKRYAAGDELYKSWLDTTPNIFTVFFSADDSSYSAGFNIPVDRSEGVTTGDEGDSDNTFEEPPEERASTGVKQFKDNCSNSDDDFLRCKFSESDFNSFMSSESGKMITIDGVPISKFSFSLVASENPHKLKSEPSLLSVTAGEVTYEVDLSCAVVEIERQQKVAFCVSINLYLLHDIVDVLAKNKNSILHKDEYNARLLAQEVLGAIGIQVVLVEDNTDWTKGLALDIHIEGFTPPARRWQAN